MIYTALNEIILLLLLDNCNFDKELYTVKEGKSVTIKLNFTKAVATTVKVALGYNNISPTTGE